MAFEPINIGATNLTSADIVRRNALPIFSRKPAWEAMFSALGAGDDIVATNNQLAFDQLFLSTASEQYLDHIISDKGFAQPKYLSLSTETLRELVIRLSAGKQTTYSLNGILSAVYGLDSTRAFISNTIPGPYDMTGEVWVFEIDGQELTLTFVAADFLSIANVPLAELVRVINIKLALLGSMGFASSTTSTHGECLRIYSGVTGIGGSIFWADTSTKPAMFLYSVGTTYYLDEIVKSGSLFYVSVYDGLNVGNAVGNATYWKAKSIWTLTDTHTTHSYVTQVQRPDLYGYNLIYTSQPGGGGTSPTPITINTILRVGTRVSGQPQADTSTTVDLSTDGGVTWAVKALPGTAPNARAAASNGTVTVVGGFSYIARSTDAGATWTEQTIGTMEITCIHWDGTNFVAVGSGGQYSYSSNGITWSTPTVIGSNSDWWSTVSSGNGEVLVAGPRWAGTDGFYVSRSTDHGQTFSAPVLVGVSFPVNVIDAYISSIMWTGSKWLFYGWISTYDNVLFLNPDAYSIYSYSASTGSGPWTRANVYLNQFFYTLPPVLFAEWCGTSGRLTLPTDDTHQRDYTFDSSGTLTLDSYVGVPTDLLFVLGSSFGYTNAVSEFYSRTVGAWAFQGNLPTRAGRIIDFNTTSGVTGGNTTPGNLLYSPLGLDGGYDFPAGASAAYAGEKIPFTTDDIGVNYILSAYVKMSDLSAPVVGTTITSGDFSIVVNDTIAIPPPWGLTTTPIFGGPGNNTVTLVDASQWPSTGTLIIEPNGPGTPETFPYLKGNNYLMLTPSPATVFAFAHPVGSLVELVAGPTYIGDDIYRVSASSTVATAATDLLSGIHRYSGQSGKAFSVTGFQLIKYNEGPGEYIVTEGSPVPTPIIAVKAPPALRITLPVTPAAISRTKFTGAYLQVGDEPGAGPPPDNLGTLPGGSLAVGIDRATYFASGKAASPTSAGYGPYLWDSNSVLMDYTNNSATLSTGIAKYGSYTSLTLGGTYNWLPVGQEFWVVIAVNTFKQTQPIRVLNRSGAVLWIDSTYQFQEEFLAGSNPVVNLVADRNGGVPPNPQDLGSCYLTGTSTAQAETIALLDSTKAAGIPVTYSTEYPGDRGLGGEGGATSGPPKLSDKIWVWGSDNPTADWIEALNG